MIRMILTLSDKNHVVMRMIKCRLQLNSKCLLKCYGDAVKEVGNHPVKSILRNVMYVEMSAAFVAPPQMPWRVNARNGMCMCFIKSLLQVILYHAVSAASVVQAPLQALW